MNSKRFKLLESPVLFRVLKKAGEVFRGQESMQKFRYPSSREFIFVVVTLTVSVQAGFRPSGDSR